MSLKFLYGPQYDELSPPLEWESLQVDASINDDSVEANINTNEFTYVDSAAEFIKDWIATYGVFNGCPHRIEVFEAGSSKVVFDGYIVTSQLQINSKLGPLIYKCPVESINSNPSVFDKVSVLTQGVLFQQGYIVPSDFVNIPTYLFPKTSVEDKLAMMRSLIYQITSTYIGLIQNALSAISDILGVSIIVGIVEAATFVTGAAIQIAGLIQLINETKALLIPTRVYYKGINIKRVIERAFQKLGYTVDFGSSDSFLDNVFLKGSNNGFGGFSSPQGNTIVPGILNAKDYGYLISEAIQTVQSLCNTRQDVRNGVVWIKTKTDPDWSSAPVFQPENALVESTQQYSNGYYRNKTEEIYATTIMNFQYDESDPWTLVSDTGDSLEIHRELITELNPKMNTLKGLQDIQINYAMAYLHDPLTVLEDEFVEAFGAFGSGLVQLQGTLGTNGGLGGADTSTLLSFLPLPANFNFSGGGMRVNGSTWAVPKLIYANLVGNQINIPVNYKDYISPTALYNQFYFPDSPAQENGFNGQKTAIEDWRIPFSLPAYLQTELNPYFVLNSNNAKFTHINWAINLKSANTEVEIDEIFDTNIKETVIN